MVSVSSGKQDIIFLFFLVSLDCPVVADHLQNKLLQATVGESGGQPALPNDCARCNWVPNHCDRLLDRLWASRAQKRARHGERHAQYDPSDDRHGLRSVLWIDRGNLACVGAPHSNLHARPILRLHFLNDVLTFGHARYLLLLATLWNWRLCCPQPAA